MCHSLSLLEELDAYLLTHDTLSHVVVQTFGFEDDEDYGEADEGGNDGEVALVIGEDRCLL